MRPPRPTSLDFGVWASVALMLTTGLAAAARSLPERDRAPAAPPHTEQPQIEAAGATFSSIRIEIDANAPLAAYQFELTLGGNATLVGVESGEHPAFAEAPYYDPEALGGDRVVIAAMNTGDDLPTGRTRICRLHFRGTHDATYEAKLIVAADANGQTIEAELHVVDE